MEVRRLPQCLRALLVVTSVMLLIYYLPKASTRTKLIYLRISGHSNETHTPETTVIDNGPSLPRPPSNLSCHYSNLAFLCTSPNAPTSPIPNVVHWIYKSTDVPDQYVALVKKCQELNPDYHFIFWSDKSALAFVKAKYPDYHYLFLKHFTSGLEFSDALRYFIVYHFGGIYLDMDVECRKPFATAMKSYRCVVDREREVQTHIYWNIPYFAMNSVMACQRNHPFFKRAINHLKVSIKEKGVLERTGPSFLSNLYRKYNNSTVGRRRPLLLAPSSVFSPLMDENHLPIFRRICQAPGPKKGLRKAACEEFKKNGYSHGNVAKLTKDSIAIHHFFHLGWGSWQFKIRKLTSMCKVARVHVFK